MPPVNMGVKTNKWNLLKHQFDALVRGEGVDGEASKRLRCSNSSPLRRINKADCGAPKLNRNALRSARSIRAIAKDLKR